MIISKELSDLFDIGTDVFGSQSVFQKWIEIPNISLNGKRPVVFLESLDGIAKVKIILGRIEHGVFS